MSKTFKVGDLVILTSNPGCEECFVGRVGRITGFTCAKRLARLDFNGTIIFAYSSRLVHAGKRYKFTVRRKEGIDHV